MISKELPYTRRASTELALSTMIRPRPSSRPVVPSTNWYEARGRPSRVRTASNEVDDRRDAVALMAFLRGREEKLLTSVAPGTPFEADLGPRVARRPAVGPEA